MEIEELVMSADEVICGMGNHDLTVIRYIVDNINHGLEKGDLTPLKDLYIIACQAIKKEELSRKDKHDCKWQYPKQKWVDEGYETPFNIVFELVCGKITLGSKDLRGFDFFYELVEAERKKSGEAKRRILGKPSYIDFNRHQDLSSDAYFG